MSRAFVNEDAGGGPEPRYDLPDPESDYYPEASARALIEGADRGDRQSAERATGFRWGHPFLVPHVRKVLEEAEASGDERRAQLAGRFLTAAGENL